MQLDDSEAIKKLKNELNWKITQVLFQQKCNSSYVTA